MKDVENAVQSIKSFANEDKAEILRRFFKTKEGEYAYGDLFLGVTVPQIRIVAKQYKHLTLNEIEQLLDNQYHEIRMLGTLILIDKFKKNPQKIFNFYINHTYAFNNWDLVDISAPKIAGEYLWMKKESPLPFLLKLTESKSLWEQRISVVTTLGLIRHGVLDPIFELAPLFLNHPHDLMHKATGWMLREAGKKNEKRLKEFLDIYATQMPRTMLRYAIEKFSKDDYKYYLNLR